MVFRTSQEISLAMAGHLQQKRSREIAVNHHRPAVTTAEYHKNPDINGLFAGGVLSYQQGVRF